MVQKKCGAANGPLKVKCIWLEAMDNFSTVSTNLPCLYKKNCRPCINRQKYAHIIKYV